MLTIIIPTKNEEVFLPILLESIKRQSIQPEEIIIADALSDDSTRNIAESFGAKITNGGLPGPGRNKGAQVAKTKYLLFLDADVVLSDTDFLRESLNEIIESKLDKATCDVLPITESRIDKIVHKFYNMYVRALGRFHAHAPGFCIFVRKDLHDSIGGFDETVTFCEDHDYALRAVRRGKFGFLSKPVPVSIRRFDRDGRHNIAIKYILAELHIMFFGPIRHSMFNYTFGHKNSNKNKYI